MIPLHFLIALILTLCLFLYKIGNVYYQAEGKENKVLTIFKYLFFFFFGYMWSMALFNEKYVITSLIASILSGLFSDLLYFLYRSIKNNIEK